MREAGLDAQGSVAGINRESRCHSGSDIQVEVRFSNFRQRVREAGLDTKGLSKLRTTMSLEV